MCKSRELIVAAALMPPHATSYQRDPGCAAHITGTLFWDMRDRATLYLYRRVRELRRHGFVK